MPEESSSSSSSEECGYSYGNCWGHGKGKEGMSGYDHYYHHQYLKKKIP